MGFNYDINAKTWEGLAQDDALWSILTDDEQKEGKWDLSKFFAAGENEITVVFNFLSKNNFLPQNFKNAIDFGCGVGRLSRFIAPYFQQTTGVDVAETMIKKARVLNAELSTSLNFIHNKQANLDIIENNSLSFIYSSIVLQHIPTNEGMLFISSFFKKLEKGGVAVFQVPTKDIRKVGLIQRFKEKVKIRQKLAVLGLVKGYQMEMNVYNTNEIVAKAENSNCKVLAHPFTNHTLAAFNGNLQFLTAQECEDYESNLFVVRKIG